MELILDDYNDFNNDDPAWTNRLPPQEVDFDTACRLIALIHIMTNPSGN